jgi:hypothetical protein
MMIARIVIYADSPTLILRTYLNIDRRCSALARRALRGVL